MVTEAKDSLSFYNGLSIIYDEISSKRYNYLSGVNQILLDFVETTNHRIKWLDLACGNGSRTLRLMRTFGKIESVTAIDSAINMVNSFNHKLTGDMRVEVICKDFTEPQDLSSEFNLITTLWNVFGHLNTEDEKLAWLQNVKKHLSKDGFFFMDFNNRYNLEYGLKTILKNMVFDLFQIKTARYPLQIEGIQTAVYIHSPGELDSLIDKAGLKIQKRLFVLYKSGELSRVPWVCGQVLLQITHK